MLTVVNCLLIVGWIVVWIWWGRAGGRQAASFRSDLLLGLWCLVRGITYEAAANHWYEWVLFAETSSMAGFFLQDAWDKRPQKRKKVTR